MPHFNMCIVFSDKLFQPLEYNWLKDIRHRCKELGATQPLGIGSVGSELLSEINELVDVFMTHMYLYWDAINEDGMLNAKSIEQFDSNVKSYADQAKKYGKGLFSTECCWGSIDDNRRTTLIQLTLYIFKKHDVGYVAYVLNESDFADSHNPDAGLVTPYIGNLCFVNKNGSLRRGHDIINQY